MTAATATTTAATKKAPPKPLVTKPTTKKAPVKWAANGKGKPAAKPVVAAVTTPKSATTASAPVTPPGPTLPPNVKLATGGGILVPVSKIKVADNDSRYYTEANDSPALQELKSSIRGNGLVQPLAVVEDGKGGYVLAAGARRLRAVKELGHKEVLANVLPASTDKRAANVAENLHRLDPTPMEIALFIENVAAQNKWQVPGPNTKDVAKILGKSAAFVTQHAKLLVHGEKERKLIHQGYLSARAGFDVADLRKAMLANGVSEKILDEIMDRARGKDAKREEERAAKAAAKATPEKAAKDPDPKTGKKEPRQLIPGSAEQTRQMRKQIQEQKQKSANKGVSVDSIRSAAAEVAAERGGDVAKAVAESGVTTRERKLSELIELVGSLEGESDGANKFVEVFNNWTSRVITDDGLVQWLKFAMDQVDIVEI